MTQMQLEYQKFKDEQALHDAQRSKLGAETAVQELSKRKVISEAQEALNRALLYAAQIGQVQMDISAKPFEVVADMGKAIGSITKGVGSLIS